MYKHFGNFGEKLSVSIILSPDFAKCRPYVIRIRIKSFTGRFHTHAVYGRNLSGYWYGRQDLSQLYWTCSIFIRIRNADTGTDLETWNKALTWDEKSSGPCWQSFVLNMQKASKRVLWKLAKKYTDTSDVYVIQNLRISACYVVCFVVLLFFKICEINTFRMRHYKRFCISVRINKTDLYWFWNH